METLQKKTFLPGRLSKAQPNVSLSRNHRICACVSDDVTLRRASIAQVFSCFILLQSKASGEAVPCVSLCHLVLTCCIASDVNQI